MSNTAVSLGTGIAVIGMSCRVADAADVDDYWLKLLQGHDSCREVNSPEWRTKRAEVKANTLVSKMTGAERRF